MFADDEDFSFPRNPALDNEEAMRRAVQVFYIMNHWANVWVAYQEGSLTGDEVVEKFNEILHPIGIAYHFEMSIEPEFYVQLAAGYSDLIAKLDSITDENEENGK